MTAHGLGYPLYGVQGFFSFFLSLFLLFLFFFFLPLLILYDLSLLDCRDGIQFPDVFGQGLLSH